MPDIISIIKSWEDSINEDFSKEEKERIREILKKLTIKSLNKLYDTEENLNE